MIRSLKTLGLALVAVLALSAVVASAASAAPKLTPVPEEYPVTLKGSQVEGVENILELEGTRKTECSTATLEGTFANKAAAETSELTATPTYSGCVSTILGNKDLTTVTMNGCDYLLKSTATTEGTIKTEGWEVTGSVEIKCPETSPGSGVFKEIEVHVFTTEAKDLANEPLCTYKIAKQTPTGDLDYKLTEKNAEGNGTSGLVKSTLTGITVTRASGTVTNCGATPQTAKLVSEVKVQGFNSIGTMLRGKFED